MPRRGERRPPAWLPEALKLAQEGMSRRKIAKALGVPPGTVLRRLWLERTPEALERDRERKRLGWKVRQPGGEGWSEARLTEPWAARKARLSAARGLQRPGGPKS